MIIAYFAVFISLAAIAVSLYVLDKINNAEAFDAETFTDDMNVQLEEIRTSINKTLTKELNEMRFEYKKGFEISLEHHEKLAEHVSKNFYNAFENDEELNAEIKSIWKKLDSLSAKKRGRPRIKVDKRNLPKI